VRKAKAIIVLLAALAGLAFLETQFNKWWDRRDNAWAYADPSLMGNWRGEATAGKTRIALVITLARDEFDWISPGDSNDDHRTIHGHAMMCDSTGRAQSYRLSGLVRDSEARETQVTFLDPPHEIPGLRASHIKLHWDGSTLQASASLVHVKERGGTWFSSSDPETGHPAAFVLHRSSEEICTPHP
jgi:hypothetical protein